MQSADKLAQRPSDKDAATFLLGAIFAREKKYDQAEQVFKDILSRDPTNAPVLNYYGYILADRGMRLDEAVTLVQRALGQDPTNAAYLDSIGWAYYKQNKLAEAETSLRKAVNRDSRDPNILAHLGDVLAKAGHADLAAAQWEKSLAEWHRVVPAEYEADKVTELERKISALKRNGPPQKMPIGTKPQ